MGAKGEGVDALVTIGLAVLPARLFLLPYPAVHY
jgi:hypothetical protein